MTAYIFPAIAALTVIFAFIARREFIRRISAVVLCAIAFIYLLLEPGVIFRATAEFGAGTFSQGVMEAGKSLTNVHMFFLAMIIGLAILAVVKFEK